MSDHDPQHDHDDQQQPAAIISDTRIIGETAIISGGEEREPKPFDESTIWGTFTFDDENDGKE